MKEELTTQMHSELIGGEINDFDLRVMSVFGAVSRDTSLPTALKEYEMTAEEYRANIDRVLSK